MAVSEEIPLDPALFMEDTARCLLQWKETYRYVVCRFYARGLHPRSEVDVISSRLGVNLVLRGSGTCVGPSGGRYRISPGTVMVRHPGRTQSFLYDPESDYAEFFVAFDEHTSDLLLQLGLIPNRPVLEMALTSAQVEDCRELVGAIAEVPGELTRRGYMVRVIEFLDRLFERARRKPEEGYWHEVVHRACLELESDLEEQIEIPEICDRLGVAYSSFRRMFRRIQGMSPQEYRVRARLERACDLLPGRSVKEVAALLGYPDPFFFSAQFRKFMGCSPSAFRKNLPSVKLPAG